MRKIHIGLSVGVLFLFSGCGGGSSPSPAPITYPIYNVEQAVDNTIYATEANIGEKVWYTNEYFANNVHDRIGSYQAYESGYSGAGVIVAVVDSGVDASNFDLDSNMIEGRDFGAFHYDTTNGDLYYTAGGIASDQVGMIMVDNVGSGYTTAPSVTVIGDGAGAEAIALLNPDGTIQGIYITEHGSGYSTVDFLIDNTGTGGSGASISGALLGGETLDFHGTAVAGLIGAERTQLDPLDPYDGGIMGVAYNASIMPIKVFDDFGNAPTQNVHAGIAYAANNGANVINLSFGTTSLNAITYDVDGISVYENALSVNSTFVIAAGNDGLKCLAVNGSIDGQCSFPAALPWVNGYENLLNQDGGWIVVGAVDDNNVMPIWNNKAGVTKNNYLVAPGVDILSTSINGEMVIASGTSFAAPVVSGAVALMYEKYPHLTGAEISNILFETATDLGDVGVDDVYGHGLINLEKAFSPIGTLRIPSSTSVNSDTTPITDTKIVVGGALAGAMINLSSINQTIGIDDYGRDFKINMSSGISYGVDSFDFDNFSVVNYDGMLIGFDQLRQNIMLGYTLGGYSLLLGTASDLFGTISSGSMDISNEQSYYVSLRKTHIFGNNYSFAYSVDYGLGQADGNPNGLISDVSDLHALGGSFVLQDLKSGFGLSYEIPLKVVSGSMDFHIPVSREIDGTVNYIDTSETMVSSATEQRYSVFHSTNIGHINLISSAELIKDAFNINQKTLEYNFTFAAKISF